MLQPNTVLQGRYRVVEQIGQGGMGAVYLAADLRLRTNVALKETFFTDEAYREAFEHEAQLLARLRHPTLPKVIDHFIENNGQFLVMEFIPGEDIDMRLKRQGQRFASAEALPWVLRWTDQLLDVLNYLHTRSSPIIHRDVKPKNLKLTGNLDIILLDFGLARGGFTQSLTGLDDKSGQPRRKVYGFTPPYAPIEQMRDGEPDPRSDLYALGATIYHLLTGTVPADAMTRMTRMMAGNPDPLIPAHEVLPHIPVPISNLLRRSLALTPEGRPGSAREMREELQRLRSGAPAGPPPVAPPITPPRAPSTPLKPLSGTATRDKGDSQPIGQPTRHVVEEPAPVPVGTLVRQLTTGTPIRVVAFSPNGQYLAAGYEDQTLSVFRVSDYSHVHTLKGHTSGIRAVTFSPDSSLLVSGSDDETVRVWQVNEGRQIRMAKVPGCSIESVQFSPDGHLLAVGGWGSAIVVFEISSERMQILSSFPSSFVLSLSFDPKGEQLVAGGYDGNLYLWNVADHGQAAPLTAHNTFVTSTSYSGDGKWIAASGGNTIRVWRPSDRKLIETLSGHSGPIRAITFRPDSSVLASASEDKSIRLWEAEGWSQLPTVLNHPAGVTSISFSPDGKLLASGSHDTKIRLWRV
jgi:eukaryotic-like serine/threonine-protein kinase